MRRIEKVQEVVSNYGGGMYLDAISKLTVHALRGNSAEAIELALSAVFKRPVIMDLEWRTRYSQPQFAEMTADPRIQAAMKQWEAEEAAIREAVRKFLLDLSTAS